MLRGTKGFLYSTLGAVMLLAAGCANEPPAPPTPAGTSSTEIIPTTPAAETGTPQAEPNISKAETDSSKIVDSAAGSGSNRTEPAPKAPRSAPAAPKAPKVPAAPELPASSVLQESGKTSAPSKEPGTQMVDPPTVGSGQAKSDGKPAAPMLPEPIEPPTISADPAEKTQSPAVSEKRMESGLWAPPTLSEPVQIQK